MFIDLIDILGGSRNTDDAAHQNVLISSGAEAAEFLAELLGSVSTVNAARIEPESGVNPLLGLLGPVYVWPHLAYAYSLENTRVVEIFRRAILEYQRGEKMGVTTPAAREWIQTTVALFFSPTPPFVDWSVHSNMRPHLEATRRNAYYRLLGMDLNHAPSDDGKYHKSEEANGTFVETFERLLAECWVGYTYRAATSSSRPTDDSAIAFLCSRLQSMLTTRRQGDGLTREEFIAVAMLSWFHATIDFNSPIVVDAGAQSASAHERLKLLGEKVGVPAHNKAENFIRLAEPLSRVLLRIEAGDFSAAAGAPLLYDTTDTAAYDIQDIITDWSMATGRDIKAAKVAVKS